MTFGVFPPVAILQQLARYHVFQARPAFMAAKDKKNWLPSTFGMPFQKPSPEQHCTSDPGCGIRFFAAPMLIAEQIGSLAQPLGRTLS